MEQYEADRKSFDYGRDLTCWIDLSAMRVELTDVLIQGDDKKVGNLVIVAPGWIVEEIDDGK